MSTRSPAALLVTAQDARARMPMQVPCGSMRGSLVSPKSWRGCPVARGAMDFQQASSIFRDFQFEQRL